MEQRDLFQHVGEATLYIQLGFLARSGAQIFELGSQAGESGENLGFELTSGLNSTIL